MYWGREEFGSLPGERKALVLMKEQRMILMGNTPAMTEIPQVVPKYLGMQCSMMG